MGTRYQQLSLEDRCAIARLQAEGRSLRQIAAALDRAPSTVSRELKRNITRQTGWPARYSVPAAVRDYCMSDAPSRGAGLGETLDIL